ncbi:hypothetical protein LUZ61_017154 [Rhynchospora tenuis]|uniref:KIB1-4 beta-propeller domain-containing protein n=1 Tax=Rhynchospora tenuis TaxID=198213 RepID=A0AAD6EKQ3_9POAL|nr:hypothetical protein LUZ61_017154 [Rhynchospora tenuis]
MATRIAVLPSELIWEIAKHLLGDGDATDYINFRTASKAIRSSLPGPRNLGFCFLPQSWIMLYKRAQTTKLVNGRVVIGNNEFKSKITKTRQSFIHLPTGQCAEIVLPELETHSILATTNSLLILADKQTRTIRLLNPLTRCISADLPPTLPLQEKGISAILEVAPSNSIAEKPTLMVALHLSDNAYFAKPGEEHSVHIQLPFIITSALFCKDRFYCTDLGGSIWEIEPKQKSVTRVIFQWSDCRCWDLVQTRAGLLLINSYPILEKKIELASSHLDVYKVDLYAKTIITLTNDIGNCAIFVGDDVKRQRVISVTPTTNNFFECNSIYVCCGTSYIYRLKERSTKFTEHPVDDYCFNISEHCKPRLTDVNRGRGRGRGRGGRGRGVDPEEEESRRRDQRDLEIAAMGRRIRELERQLAEARMGSTNGEEGEESETLNSSEADVNFANGVVAKLKANRSQDRRMRHGSSRSISCENRDRRTRHDYSTSNTRMSRDRRTRHDSSSFTDFSECVVNESISFDSPPIFDEYPDDDDNDVFNGTSEIKINAVSFDSPAIFGEELVDDLLLPICPTTFEKSSCVRDYIFVDYTTRL